MFINDSKKIFIFNIDQLNQYYPIVFQISNNLCKLNNDLIIISDNRKVGKNCIIIKIVF